MRRVIVFLTSLTLALLMGVGTASAAPTLKRPLPTTLKATVTSGVGSAGSLVPIAGTLTDAKRRPLTGLPVEVSVAGAPQASTLQSLTGSGGAFEVYVPLPDDLPSTGMVELEVTFNGTPEAAASSVTLAVRIEPASGPASAELQQRVGGPAPAATAPAERNGAAVLPTSGSAFIDQLILVAAGLLGVMVVLFGVGAVLRRRRG